jgi:16S rRNA pseudouridine516 synthase
VTLRDPVTPKQIERLCTGVILEDGYKTLPAQAKSLEKNVVELIITEGKYHQIKRMFISLGNEVTHLKRIAIGPWRLEDL